MVTHILLPHTPAVEQRPPVHPIPESGAVFDIIISSSSSSSSQSPTKLRIDTTRHVLTLGDSTSIRCGASMKVSRHFFPNFINIDTSSVHLTFRPMDPKHHLEILGMLHLFSFSPCANLLLLRPLYVGALSVVFLAIEKHTGSFKAVRQTRMRDIRCSRGSQHILESSRHVLSTLLPRHNNVLHPQQQFSHAMAQHTVTDLYTPLHESLNALTLTPSTIRKVMRSILQALAHMHRHGVTHGNLCAQHVVHSSDFVDVKVTGLGHVTHVTQTRDRDWRDGLRGAYALHRSAKVTPPEGNDAKHPQMETDVWSAGRILRDMFCVLEDVPKDLERLALALMQQKRKARLTARAALEHEALVDEEGENELGSEATETTTEGSEKESEGGDRQECVKQRFQKAVVTVSCVVSVVAALRVSVSENKLQDKVTLRSSALRFKRLDQCGAHFCDTSVALLKRFI